MQRQRVIQSSGAVLDAASSGPYMLNSVAGLTVIGNTWSASTSEFLFGFFVPIPVIIKSEDTTSDVVAGSRIWTWPNPFRENVTIEVQLGNSPTAEAEIFSSIGQHVATAELTSLRTGVATFTWSGMRADGTLCTAGTYTLRILMVEPIRQRRLMYSSTITRIR